MPSPPIAFGSAGSPVRGMHVAVNEKQLADVHRLLDGMVFRGKGAAGVALQAAISRTITTGVTRIARRIGEEVRLPIAEIKETISTTKGSHKEPEGSIIVTRKGVP